MDAVVGAEDLLTVSRPRSELQIAQWAKVLKRREQWRKAKEREREKRRGAVNTAPSVNEDLEDEESTMTMPAPTNSSNGSNSFARHNEDRGGGGGSEVGLRDLLFQNEKLWEARVGTSNAEVEYHRALTRDLLGRAGERREKDRRSRGKRHRSRSESNESRGSSVAPRDRSRSRSPDHARSSHRRRARSVSPDDRSPSPARGSSHRHGRHSSRSRHGRSRGRGSEDRYNEIRAELIQEAIRLQEEAQRSGQLSQRQQYGDPRQIRPSQGSRIPPAGLADPRTPIERPHSQVRGSYIVNYMHERGCLLNGHCF